MKTPHIPHQHHPHMTCYFTGMCLRISLPHQLHPVVVIIALKMSLSASACNHTTAHPHLSSPLACNHATARTHTTTDTHLFSLHACVSTALRLWATGSILRSSQMKTNTHTFTLRHNHTLINTHAQDTTLTDSHKRGQHTHTTLTDRHTYSR